MGSQNGSDRDYSVRSHFFCPRDKTFTIPLHILLMVSRHMLSNGAILAFSPIAPGMRANAMIMKKDFYYLTGNPNIHWMLDIFIGYTVIHLLYRYVIIKLYDGYFPEGQLVGRDRQRLQGLFFFCQERSQPVAVFLLKRFTVKDLQFLPNGNV